MAFNDPTTNFGWELPDIDGDTDDWGRILNEIFGGDTPVDGIDTVVNNIKTTADAALARSGGNMSGRVDMHSAAWDLVALGNMSGTVNIDLSSGNFFHGTLTGDVTTVNFQNVPSNAVFFVLEITTDAGPSDITWPSEVKWPGGAAPTLTANTVDVLVFYTRDGGTTVRGAIAMSDSS